MEIFPNQQAPQPNLGVAGETAERTSEFFDFWGLVSRRKWIVFLGILVGLGLGYLYHTRADIVYRCKAKVMIQPKSSTKVIDDRNRGGPPVSEEYVESHDLIMKSKTFIGQTLAGIPESDDWGMFRNMSMPERIKTVLNGLSVLQDSRDSNFFEIETELWIQGRVPPDGHRLGH